MTDSLNTLATPCLLLDRARFERNLDRMAAALPPGMPFRPHLKTAKSEQVAHRTRQRFGDSATVSTLREAEVFGAQGLSDLLYGVAITADKLPRVAELNRQGIKVTIVTDSPEMAAEIARYPQGCMRADRRSVYLQHGLSVEDGLKSEWQNSVGMLVEEGLEGATRFSGGKGRHGDFGDI